jgi:hypothetical protein
VTVSWIVVLIFSPRFLKESECGDSREKNLIVSHLREILSCFYLLCSSRALLALGLIIPAWLLSKLVVIFILIIT